MVTLTVSAGAEPVCRISFAANVGAGGRTPDMISLASILLFSTPIHSGPGLHFVDVGQGSALLLRAESGELVLVDSGPASGAEAVLHAIAEHEPEPEHEHESSELALWVHTHHDADHIGGFAPLLAGLDGRLGSDDDLWFAQLWDRGLAGPLPDSEAFAVYLALAHERREVPEPGTVFELAGLRIEALALDPPPADAPENDRGLALCVEVGRVRALLPGDVSAERLELAAAACPDVDVLWLSHHGAANASSTVALELADPKLVVVSAGHDNLHCHPSALALALTHDRRTGILDAAGLDPRGACPPLAEALSPEQRLVGGDLWIDDALGVWIGGPTGNWLPVN
jgi:beta-lactamase superfamily II metal-dependent hydrolase